MSNKLATLARLAGGILTEGPRALGEGLGEAIVAPFERKRLETERETDSTVEQILARRAQQSGDYQPLQRFLESSAQRQMQAGKNFQDTRRKGITGGAKTAFTLAAAGPLNRGLTTGVRGGSSIPALVRLGVGAGIGSTLGGGLSAIQGQDPIEGAVRGGAESVKTTGLTNFTAPVFNPMIRAVAGGPVQERAGRAVVGGLTNLAEDEAFTRTTEMRAPTANERLFSGLMGAITAQAPLEQKNELVDAEEPVKQVKKYVRDAEGQFAKIKKSIQNKLKGKLPSEVEDLIQMRADKKKLIQVGDRKFKFETPEEAAGFVAGLEFEMDEEGKISGVTYNPTKGMIGVAGIMIPKVLSSNKPQEIEATQSPFQGPTQGKFASLGQQSPQQATPQGPQPTTQTMDQQIRASQAAQGQTILGDLDDAINTQDAVKTQQLIDQLRSLPPGDPLRNYIDSSVSIANRLGLGVR